MNYCSEALDTNFKPVLLVMMSNSFALPAVFKGEMRIAKKPSKKPGQRPDSAPLSRAAPGDPARRRERVSCSWLCGNRYA